VILIKDTKEEEVDQEERDAWDREFARALGDLVDTRKMARQTAPPVFDTAVPLIRKQQQKEETSQATPSNHMQFSLLSKKGNKQQVSACKY
jgi:regulator of nonsense transcripts 2